METAATTLCRPRNINYSPIEWRLWIIVRNICKGYQNY